MRLWLPARGVKGLAPLKHSSHTGGKALKTRGASCCSCDSRQIEPQEPGRVGAEDRASLALSQTRAALDKPDRINFAHVGGVVGADEDVVGAVEVDEVLQLVMGVDERVE